MVFHPDYLRGCDGFFCEVTGKHRFRWLLVYYLPPKETDSRKINLDRWEVDHGYGDGWEEITPDDWEELEFAFHGSKTKAIKKAKEIKKENRDLIHGIVQLIPQIGTPIPGSLAYDFCNDPDWEEVQV